MSLFGQQCLKFFEILEEKEKKAFFAFLLLFVFSFVFLSTSFYLKNTKIIPSPGGKIIERVVGQPRFINPVLSPVSDVDRDLVELIFSGLMKFDSQGRIVPDLAKDYQVKDEGKTWEIILKENLVFQDDSPLTTDDVIFTIKLIQNPDYKSPLRPNWLGVEVEKISDLRMRFKLKNSFPAFLENLTLKIIPKKIWQEVLPENFPLSTFNFKPVGSGPYRLTRILQRQGEKDKGKIQDLVLEINPSFHGELPKIKEIAFRFFDNEKELIEAAEKGEKINNWRFHLPRYFAVFFNQKNSSLLSQKEVRQALNFATNKREIIDEVFDGTAFQVASPILSDLFGFADPQTNYKFSLKKANQLLDKAGFKINPETRIREKLVKKDLSFQFKSILREGSQGVEVKELQKCLARDLEVYPEGEITGVFGKKTFEAVKRFQEKYREEILVPAGLKEVNGEVKTLTRQKLNEVCFGPKEELLQMKFSLMTVEDPVLLKTAWLLKEQWRQAGIDLEIKSFIFNQLNQEYLRPRNYQLLLFGEVLGKIADPFPFWHSSQKKDPGLNLALYDNKEADKLLEESRQTLDENLRKEKLEKFQDILLADAPAVFLYRPDFLYPASDKIKGINAGFIADPSQRFAEIEKWYINTKRVWK